MKELSNGAVKTVAAKDEPQESETKVSFNDAACLGTFTVSTETMTSSAPVHASPLSADAPAVAEMNCIEDKPSSRRRVFRLVRQRRKKVKRQSSLVELTWQWLVVNATGLFGEQLDRKGLYLAAMLILIACFGLMMQTNLFVMLAVAGLCTVAFCAYDVKAS